MVNFERAMSQSKPSYIGLLNAIALGEERGYQLLSAWANTTPNAAVAEVLRFVALREREHAATFAKRLSELGFQVLERPSKSFAKNLRRASGKASDKKKFRKILNITPGAESRPDELDKLLADPTIDPVTGALLGRFICEERDSGRRLRACCAALDQPQPDDDEALLRGLTDRLDRLTETLGELKSLRSDS